MDVLCLRLIGLLLLSSVLTFFSFLVFVRHSILPGLTSGSRPSQRHHTELWFALTSASLDTTGTDVSALSPFPSLSRAMLTQEASLQSKTSADGRRRSSSRWIVWSLHTSGVWI
jgi:hypothetical protein